MLRSEADEAVVDDGGDPQHRSEWFSVEDSKGNHRAEGNEEQFATPVVELDTLPRTVRCGSTHSEDVDMVGVEEAASRRNVGDTTLLLVGEDKLVLQRSSTMYLYRSSSMLHRCNRPPLTDRETRRALAPRSTAWASSAPPTRWCTERI